MNEIPCNATRMLLHALEASGIAPERAFAGFPLPLSVDELRDPRNRIAWDTFAALHDHLEPVVGGPRGLEELGRRIVYAPGYEFLRKMAGYFVSPEALFWAADRWVGPMLFPHLEVARKRLGRGRLRIVARIPDGDRDSPGLFRVVAGCISEIPRLLGLPAAHVETELRPLGVTFDITLPRSLPLADRLRRASKALLGARVAIAEIARQQAEISAGYFALLRTRSDFRRVIEQLTDWVVVHRDGRIVWANQATMALLGLERIDQVVGRQLLEFVPLEDRATIAARMARPPDPSPGLREFRLLRRDGAIVQVEVAPTQVIEFDGTPARVVLGRDVTERRRLEAQLLLADRMASLGTLAAGVAHEINNPLAYVHANLEVAAREIAGRDLPRVSVALATALDGTERVRAIVRDLKTFSRGDDEAVGPVDVAGVLESTAHLAAREVARKARLELDLAPVPPVRGTAARLGQVALNLLINAADAIREGDPARNQIRLRTALAKNGRVVVEIADTGCGIPREALPRLFDPFYTTKPVGAGTGLGLAICHGIVTRLGGTIEVESTVGRGSTFRVLLPALGAAATGDTRAPSPPPIAEAGERARVLVVEDELPLARAMAALLGEHHEVAIADDGRTALELVLGGREFDVILCDLMMAGMNGMELYEELRRVRPGAEARIVFVTGGAFTPRAREFVGTVSNRCLEKPVSRDELLAAVRAAIA